jgi:hypothetical protein
VLISLVFLGFVSYVWYLYDHRIYLKAKIIQKNGPRDYRIGYTYDGVEYQTPLRTGEEYQLWDVIEICLLPPDYRQPQSPTRMKKILIISTCIAVGMLCLGLFSYWLSKKTRGVWGWIWVGCGVVGIVIRDIIMDKIM